MYRNRPKDSPNLADLSGRGILKKISFNSMDHRIRKLLN